MLHRTGKNWLLNLHFPLQAAWLRQSDSVVSSCHLSFPFLALPEWHLTALPGALASGNARLDPPSLLAQDQQGASLCPHLTWSRISGKFYSPCGPKHLRVCSPEERTWGCAAQSAARPYPGAASSHPNTGIQQGHWSYKPHNPQALL